MRSIRFVPWLRLLVMVAGLATAVPLLGQDAPPPEAGSTNSIEEAQQRQAEIDARVAELIEQLGSPEYAVRAKAKSSLERLGLAAFDALNDAQSHRDPEIGMQARYLMRSARVAWVLDNDPPEVKPILKQYGTQLPSERETRIARLAQIDDRKSWPALCRLVRYETDEQLSRQAALAIITQAAPSSEESADLAARLQLGVAESRRRGAEWLRAYAAWLVDREGARDTWERLVDEEFALLTQEEAKTTPRIATALGRWYAESLSRIGRDDDTKQVVTRLGSLIDGSEEALLEHVDWLGKQRMWQFVLDAYADHTALFEADPMLLYRVAEAQRRLELADSAATAERARDLNRSAEAHTQAGFALVERGLFDWAEQEYRAVIDDSDVGSVAGMRARFLLSEMLHDQQKEIEAAKVLEPVVDVIDRPDVRDVVERMGREAGGIKSRMHYFFALDLMNQGRVDEAKERLRRGSEEDSADADVLIALFRLTDQTEQERERVRGLIRDATRGFQEQIAEHARNLAQSQAQAQNEAIANYFKQQLAMAHNQMAWLVANTEGDFEAAVASSHESLKLRPQTSAYLDTLGRAYYAKGDLASAIKYQSEALRLDPHSGQMRRQLEFFKSEAEKKQKGPLP